MGDKRIIAEALGNVAQAVPIAAIALAIAWGVVTYQKNHEAYLLEQSRIAAGYQRPVLQVADLNNNGVMDKFYVVDGKVAVVELDGKPVAGTIENKLTN